MKALRPFFFIMAFVLIIGLACSFGTGTSTEQPATQPPAQAQPTEAPPPAQEQPTEAPPPTAEVLPTEVPPTEAPPAQEKFFTEQFDQDPGSAWSYKVIGPGAEANSGKATYSFDAGRMIFKHEASDLYAYYTYTGQSYDDARLDINYENRGVNTQLVGLLCRVTDEGWYEFDVTSDGRWELDAFDGKRYTMLANGGSTKIKQGKAVNEYSFVCQGDKLAFFINGSEPKGSPYVDRKFAFRRGNVGFTVQSLHPIPVRIEVDWFKVGQP